MNSAPGAYRHLEDHWASFPACARTLSPGALVIADARVLNLHPAVDRALARARPLDVLALTAGESAKTLTAVERVLTAGQRLPRSGTLLCVGGGTLGDLATVAAHLLKRGVELIHCPSTLLAAVDSSVGGKGAVHIAGVKNAAGVFHYPARGWLCAELWQTLSEKQRMEGAVEAYKMACCLDARAWRAWRTRVPEVSALVRRARAMKDAVCRADPYERSGRRALLNFGHTFGHAIESLTRFRVSHGEAVAMGIALALEIGVRAGLTPQRVADEVEEVFARVVRAPGRAEASRVLKRYPVREIAALLGADKKGGRMVLLERIGRASLR